MPAKRKSDHFENTSVFIFTRSPSEKAGRVPRNYFIDGEMMEDFTTHSVGMPERETFYGTG